MIIHVNKEGKKVPLCAVEDSHLRNIIGYLLKRLQGAKDVLNKEPSSKFQHALYGFEYDEDGAREFVARFDERIAPYFTEALIRGMDVHDAVVHYQVLIERTGRVEMPKEMFAREPKLISAVLVEDDPYDDYDYDQLVNNGQI